MPHTLLQERKPSRRELALSQAQPQAGGGMDPTALIGMLTHLYGLSQQQAQAPGQMRHQDLQNQMEELQLRNAPEDLKRKNALADAQISALGERPNSDPNFPYYDVETQGRYLDAKFPQRVADRAEADRLKDVAQWPDVMRQAQTGLLPTGVAAEHWGGPAMEYLQGLHQNAAAPQASGHPGQVLHDKITALPQTIPAAYHGLVDPVNQFIFDLFGKPKWMQQAPQYTPQPGNYQNNQYMQSLGF